VGSAKIPVPVKYFSAILFSAEISRSEIHRKLTREFGPIDLESPVFNFTYTNYYVEEMGESLQKQFVSFERLCMPDELAAIKNRSNKIEEAFYRGNRRCVNLDPGYIELAKMILASTKNFSHRIYLGEGIYGDLQYRFRLGEYTFLEWTYPDYKDAVAVNFFREIRTIYSHQLEKGNFGK